MKIYLIDFENVKSKGLTGIDSLTEYDRVIIFYSENADTINFEMHQKVLISKAEVEYFKVHVGGKNALDFQLSTLLGYLVSKNYYTHIFVISNDKSFDFLHDFWHGKYIAAPDCIVYRTKTIAQAINYAGGKKQAVTEEDDIDDSVFAPQDTSAETAAAVSEVKEEPKTPVADTSPVTAAEVTAAPAAEKKEEPKKATEVTDNTPAQVTEKIAEKRTPKDNPKKDAPKKNEKKSADDKKDKNSKDDYFTISTEELNALEASFSAYSIIPSAAKTAEVPANNEVKKVNTEPVKTEPVKTEPVKTEPAKAESVKTEETVTEEKKEPVKAVKPAEQPAADNTPAEKPKQKVTKEFYPALKEVLKNSSFKPEEINHISQLLVNSYTKEEFHNTLAKEYKQDATELYKLLRPKYLRLKEMYAAEHPEYVSPDTVIVRNDDNKKAVQPAESVKPAEDDKNSAKASDKNVNDAVKPEQTKAAENTETEKKAETVPAQAEVQTENKTVTAPEAETAAAEKPAKTAKRKTADKTAKKEKAADTKKEKPKKARSKKTEEKPAENIQFTDNGDKLAELLDGSCSSEEIELIRQLFREVPSRQQLYIRMIKQFGKKSGCVYYNAIKGEYESLSKDIK